MAFDYLSSFYFPIFFLHKAGLYMEKSSSWIYRIYGLTLYLIFSVGTIFHTIFVFQSFATDDIKKFATALNMTLTLYSVQYKALWFVSNLQNIKRVLVDLLDLCQRGKQNRNLEKQTVRISKVVKIYFGSAFLAVAVPLVLSLVHHRSRMIPFETSNLIGYKRNVFIYWFMIFYQLLISIYGIVVNYSADLFPVILMAFASGFLKDLSEEMEMVCSATGKVGRIAARDNSCDKNLGKFIDRHQKIKKLVQKISEHFSQVVLWQAVMSSAIFCTSVFLLTIVSTESQQFFNFLKYFIEGFAID